MEHIVVQMCMNHPSWISFHWAPSRQNLEEQGQRSRLQKGLRRTSPSNPTVVGHCSSSLSNPIIAIEASKGGGARLRVVLAQLLAMESIGGIIWYGRRALKVADGAGAAPSSPNPSVAGSPQLSPAMAGALRGRMQRQPLGQQIGEFVCADL